MWARTGVDLYWCVVSLVCCPLSCLSLPCFISLVLSFSSCLSCLIFLVMSPRVLSPLSYHLPCLISFVLSSPVSYLSRLASLVAPDVCLPDCCCLPFSSSRRAARCWVWIACLVQINVILREEYSFSRDVAKHLVSNYGTRALQVCAACGTGRGGGRGESNVVPRAENGGGSYICSLCSKLRAREITPTCAEGRRGEKRARASSKATRKQRGPNSYSSSNNTLGGHTPLLSCYTYTCARSPRRSPGCSGLWVEVPSALYVRPPPELFTLLPHVLFPCVMPVCDVTRHDRRRVFRKLRRRWLGSPVTARSPRS